MSDDDEESYESNLKEHGDGAPELHRRGDALLSARQDEENLKLRELMRMKDRAPTTRTTPGGSRNES